MAPEDKMLERFTQEKQRRHKNSAFDLEDDENPGELTHMGQSLSLDGPAIQDDFDDEEDLELSDAEDHPSDDERQALKRRRGSDGEDVNEETNEENDRPERKKSKQEVMKELVAKSKLHKYERQNAKDDDEDLREELDKEMSSIHELLQGIPRRPAPAAAAAVAGMNPDRAALLTGAEKIKLDKEYDLQFRRLQHDKRSKPTERTKTDEEKAEEANRNLRDNEAKRLRRMQGVPESEDEQAVVDEASEDDYEEEDFGLGSGIKARPSMAELGVEDEDDFLIDDDLVASGSDAEPSDDDSEDEVEDGGDNDADFLQGLLTEEESQRPEFLTGANAPQQETDLPAKNGVNGDLAYTFPCPETHRDLLDVTKNVVLLDLPTVVQRIRALYHPKLKAENKAKLGKFAVSLVDHISYLPNQEQRPPYAIIENLIRHIHSLAKSFPTEIANAFRLHLQDIHDSRALFPTPGDLVVLTAIGTIFPTSDHFHQVVTPAMLTIGRYLGQKIPQTISDYALGAYLTTLSLQYQKLSKRYVPEVVSFIENTLCALAPTKISKIPGSFPYHEPKIFVRIEHANVTSRALSFYDCIPQEASKQREEILKVALLETNIGLLDAAADTWTGKSAFTEVFGPSLQIFQHLGSKACRTRLPETSKVRSGLLLFPSLLP